MTCHCHFNVDVTALNFCVLNIPVNSFQTCTKTIFVPELTAVDSIRRDDTNWPKAIPFLGRISQVRCHLKIMGKLVLLALVSITIYMSKNWCTQHDFDIVLYCDWLSWVLSIIIKSLLSLKRLLYPFLGRLMPYLLGLFQLGLHAGWVNLKMKSKSKTCKTGSNCHGKCMLCRVYDCMHAYSLPIHYAETVRNFVLNTQWVPLRVKISHKMESANASFPIQLRSIWRRVWTSFVNFPSEKRQSSGPRCK